jgi:hypothetical protein
MILYLAALGLEDCIEQTWRDSAMYIEGDSPIMIGRAYGRVSRTLLRDELVRRCVIFFLFVFQRSEDFAAEIAVVIELHYCNFWKLWIGMTSQLLIWSIAGVLRQELNILTRRLRGYWKSMRG